MENALLAKESRERNKILECLLSFEKKGKHNSPTNGSNGEFSSGPNMSKAKKLIDIQDMQNIKTNRNEEIGQQVNRSKQNNGGWTKNKKKAPAKRKKNKTLWENDSQMFAN